MFYVLNAFSLNMVADDATIQVRRISAARAAELLRSAQGVVNAIGHAETDALVRDLFADLSLPVGQRLTVKLGDCDEAIVAQYIGPRLPEGATALPEGATIEFRRVLVGDAS